MPRFTNAQKANFDSGATNLHQISFKITDRKTYATLFRCLVHNTLSKAAEQDGPPYITSRIFITLRRALEQGWVFRKLCHMFSNKKPLP